MIRVQQKQFKSVLNDFNSAIERKMGLFMANQNKYMSKKKWNSQSEHIEYASNKSASPYSYKILRDA